MKSTIRYTGYSTDIKPTSVNIGDRFLEIDTRAEYIFAGFNKWVQEISQAPRTIKVSLTSEQIKTGYSTPVLVIPAPGAGKCICIHNCFGKFNYNTAKFETGDVFLLDSETTNELWHIDDMLNNDASVIRPGYRVMQALSENSGVKFNVGDDSEVGDSTLDLHITYEIVSL